MLESNKPVKKKKNHRYTAEQKAEFVRRHLKGGESVKGICASSTVQPSQLYTWEKEVFENMAEVLESKKPGRKKDKNAETKKLSAQVAALEAKLQRKEHVISEIIEENVELTTHGSTRRGKKSSGEL